MSTTKDVRSGRGETFDDAPPAAAGSTDRDRALPFGYGILPAGGTGTGLGAGGLSRLSGLRGIIDGIAAERQNDDPDQFESFDAVSARLRTLVTAGVGALRIPVELGGAGLGFRDFFEVIIALGSADSNLPHILIQHFHAVEVLLRHPDRNRVLLDRIAAGLLIGAAFNDGAWPATSGTGDGGDGDTGGPARDRNGEAAGHGPGAEDGGARLEVASDGGYRLSALKRYTTGAAYSDLLQVKAVLPDGSSVFAWIPRTRAGVEVLDDWDGIGQGGSASGSVRFDAVVVAENEIARPERAPHVEVDFQQFIITATLAGIADAAARDATALAAARERWFPLGLGVPPRDDPLIQTTVGRFWAQATAARAFVLHVADRADEATQLAAEGILDLETVDRLFVEADVLQLQAQGFVVPLVVDQAATVFDALGGTEVTRKVSLHRHWLNARTLASHNPVVYKLRQVGDYAVNGAVPEQIGVPRRDA